MMRPQKKQQQQYQNMLSNLQKGAHVVTIGGLYGVIDSIDRDKNTVVLDCDGIYLTFKLRAIREIVDEKNTTSAAPKAKVEKVATSKEDNTDTEDTKATVEANKSTDTNDESANTNDADQSSDK